jgi:hypothetical protein
MPTTQRNSANGSSAPPTKTTVNRIRAITDKILEVDPDFQSDTPT